MEGLAPDDVTWLRERVVERLLTELSDELREALVLARCATPAEAPELLLDAGPPGR